MMRFALMAAVICAFAQIDNCASGDEAGDDGKAVERDRASGDRERSFSRRRDSDDGDRAGRRRGGHRWRRHARHGFSDEGRGRHGTRRHRRWHRMPRGDDKPDRARDGSDHVRGDGQRRERARGTDERGARRDWLRRWRHRRWASAGGRSARGWRDARRDRSDEREARPTRSGSDWFVGRMFDRFDADGDGELSRREFADGLQSWRRRFAERRSRRSR